MFKPEDFKQDQKVILLMEGEVSDPETHNRMNFGDILLKGDIEHVWNDQERNSYDVKHGKRYCFILNIQAHSQDDVWVANEVKDKDKPTFLSISFGDSKSNTVWLKPYDELLFMHLKEVLTSRTKLYAALAVENNEIKELLK